MNQDDGSYQLELPHIYDYLLSTGATPGGQSFRRRQQRLPKRQHQTKQRLNLHSILMKGNSFNTHHTHVMDREPGFPLFY